MNEQTGRIASAQLSRIAGNDRCVRDTRKDYGFVRIGA
jgi:hypothetical protein